MSSNQTVGCGVFTTSSLFHNIPLTPDPPVLHPVDRDVHPYHTLCKLAVHPYITWWILDAHPYCILEFGESTRIVLCGFSTLLDPGRNGHESFRYTKTRGLSTPGISKMTEFGPWLWLGTFSLIPPYQFTGTFDYYRLSQSGSAMDST